MSRPECIERIASEIAARYVTGRTDYINERRIADMAFDIAVNIVDRVDYLSRQEARQK